MPKSVSDKTPLLFLPGMMCDERLFAPQIACFSADFAINVPLFAGRRMADIAATILAGAPATFGLCGLSMGGIVAMEIMRQAPERVSHLALLDTNPYAEKVGVAQKRARQMAIVQDDGLADIMRDEMKPNYLAPSSHQEPMLALCMDMAQSLGSEAFIAQSYALRDRDDYCAILQQVRCPTLILCGRHDALCPPDRHQDMANMITAAELVVIEDAGHLPTIEAPEQTNHALAALWER